MSLSFRGANKMSSLISEPCTFLRWFVINIILLFLCFATKENSRDANNNDYKWCHKAKTCLQWPWEALRHQPQRTSRKKKKTKHVTLKQKQRKSDFFFYLLLWKAQAAVKFWEEVPKKPVHVTSVNQYGKRVAVSLTSSKCHQSLFSITSCKHESFSQCI